MSDPGANQLEAAEERRARLALWLQPGVSGRRLATAAAELGGAAGALAAPREQLVAALRLVGVAAARLRSADPLAQAAREEAALAARGGRFVLRGDPDYPARLLALADPPEALAVRGTLPAGPALAIVGAREAPAGARQLAAAFAGAAGLAGRAVISGGAFGVDAAAHRGALEARGSTAAVLGSGVLLPSPLANRPLFAAILGGDGGAPPGALLSELPVREPASTVTFPRRNRLIAALADAVLVVHARAGSGSLLTAAAMTKLGRPVLAVPDGGAGAAALVASGALPVRSPGDLLVLLGHRPPPQPLAAEGLPPGAASLLAALPSCGGALSLAELAVAAALPARAAAGALALLFDRGLARSAGPGRFTRVQ